MTFYWSCFSGKSKVSQWHFYQMWSSELFCEHRPLIVWSNLIVEDQLNYDSFFRVVFIFRCLLYCMHVSHSSSSFKAYIPFQSWNRNITDWARNRIIYLFDLAHAIIFLVDFHLFIPHEYCIYIGFPTITNSTLDLTNMSQNLFWFMEPSFFYHPLYCSGLFWDVKLYPNRTNWWDRNTRQM